MVKSSKQKNKKQSIGRSMIEMLGVLVIIAVLSLSALWGIQALTIRNDANNIAKDVMLRALVLSNQILSNANPSLDEFPKLTGKGYGTGFALQTEDDPPTFTIIVGSSDNGGSPVSKKVCKRVSEMDWSLATVLPEECADENVMSFMFDTDLANSIGKENGSDCTIWEECRSGVCSGGKCAKCTRDTNCPTGQACLKNVGECVRLGEPKENNEECTNYLECKSGVCTDGLCVSCLSNEDCPQNEICNIGTGICERAQCTQDSDCGDGEICDTQTGLCVDDLCDVDADCASFTPQPQACRKGRCLPCRKAETYYYFGEGRASSCCVDGETTRWDLMPYCETNDLNYACSGNGSCVVCPEGKTPMCGSNNFCFCVAPGETSACGADGCIVCPEGETPVCKTVVNSLSNAFGSCVCQAPGETVACSPEMCISCPSGATPVCSNDSPPGGYGAKSSCVCQAPGETSACSEYRCISCPSGETAVCSIGSSYADNDGECVCRAPGETSACSTNKCISCPSGETPVCSSTYGPCTCRASGETAACNNKHCITCPSGETAVCSTEGSCICRASGETSECSKDECISCPSGEIPVCVTHGTCVCLAPGETPSCSTGGCVICSEEETPLCQRNCVCVGPNDSSACSNRGDCIVCHDGETAVIINDPRDIPHVFCTAPGETVACSAFECVICPEGETPLCPTGPWENPCLCVAPGETGACSFDKCISCPEGETPVCSTKTTESGGCRCQKPGESVACNQGCITCILPQVAQCGWDDYFMCECITP